MKGGETTQFPQVLGLSPIAPILLIANIGFKSGTLMWVILGIVVVELIAKFVFKMGIAMFFRRLKTLMSGLFFGNKLYSTPPSWVRNHWPVVGAIFVVTAVTIPSSSTYAQYTVTDSVRWDREWNTGALGMSKNDVLEAMCKSCPLNIALQQILPKDFTPYVNDRVNDVEVNFVAGKPWGQVLENVATKHNLKIELHKNGRRAIVDPAAKNRGGVSLVTSNSSRTSFYDTKTFELIPGDTLKESLERWGRSENWDVLYELDSGIYIDVPARFEGNLLEAVEQVLNAYREAGILSRVSMTYSHANSVIRISLADGE